MMSLSYSFVMPPTLFIAICLVAALLALRYRRVGVRLMLAGALLLYLSALPITAQELSHYLAVPTPGAAELSSAQAIVVLGAGLHLGDGAGKPDTLDELSIERLAWAAELHRRLPLPVAVTGGRLRGSTSSLGALMKQELEQNFGIPVAWSEEVSRTTFENAEFIAPILKAAGYRRVIVVTNRWHLARAIWSFRHAGLDAIPYPTTGQRVESSGLAGLFPNLKALQETSYDIHEILGLAYYKLRQ